MRPIYCATHAEHPLEFAPNCPDCEVEALRMDWAARGAELASLRERLAEAEAGIAKMKEVQELYLQACERLAEAEREIASDSHFQRVRNIVERLTEVEAREQVLREYINDTLAVLDTPASSSNEMKRELARKIRAALSQPEAAPEEQP